MRRQDGLRKVPAASVLSTAPPSWVGSVCVEVSHMNLREVQETTKCKGKWMRMYNISRLLMGNGVPQSGTRVSNNGAYDIKYIPTNG